jgi:type IV fimbrial biogenesis protein FimT
MDTRPAAGRRTSGFTLIELLVTITIVAVLIALAAPSLRDAFLNVRMSAQANDLVADLSIARSEASKRNARVVLCTSTNGTGCTGTPWEQGWLVFVDTGAAPNGARELTETIVKVAKPAAAGTTITTTGVPNGAGGSPYVSYRSSGMSNPGGAAMVFTVCDSRTTTNVGAANANGKGRQVLINSTGRPAVRTFTCP